MLASRSSSSSSFLEYVIDKLEPNAAAEARAQDCEGASALHHAARAGHAEAIDALARMAPDLDFDLKDQVSGRARLQNVYRKWFREGFKSVKG